MAGKAKTKRGRPVTKKMSEKIDGTPENVARVLMRTKPKAQDEWEYLKKKSA